MKGLREARAHIWGSDLVLCVKMTEERSDNKPTAHRISRGASSLLQTDRVMCAHGVSRAIIAGDGGPAASRTSQEIVLPPLIVCLPSELMLRQTPQWRDATHPTFGVCPTVDLTMLAPRDSRVAAQA